MLAKTKDHRTYKLITGLQDDTLAHFIEHEIEAILGLEDERVDGEVYKPTQR
ncbi:MAG: hypothetical protein ABF315_07630 [Lentimonas sp.]